MESAKPRHFLVGARLAVPERHLHMWARIGCLGRARPLNSNERSNSNDLEARRDITLDARAPHEDSLGEARGAERVNADVIFGRIEQGSEGGLDDVRRAALYQEDAVLKMPTEAGEGLIDLATARVVDDVVGDQDGLTHCVGSEGSECGITCARSAVICVSMRVRGEPSWVLDRDIIASYAAR